MTVSVVVPYRPDGGHRDAVWQYVREWWADVHPRWQVVTGTCPPGPWVKALAVADALTRASGDILVVADADVLTDGVGYAVEAVRQGGPWCVPHQRVLRLTETATAALLAGGPVPEAVARQHPSLHQPGGPILESYTGLVGGGMVVLPRTTYDRVPLDPRFRGWSLEDASWGLALEQVAGTPPRRSPADLWHLWHPPQPRMSRAVGSPESLALYERYLAAARDHTLPALLSEMSDVVGKVC